VNNFHRFGHYVLPFTEYCTDQACRTLDPTYPLVGAVMRIDTVSDYRIVFYTSNVESDIPPKVLLSRLFVNVMSIRT